MENITLCMSKIIFQNYLTDFGYEDKLLIYLPGYSKMLKAMNFKINNLSCPFLNYF
jgi:hypothetical protein